MPRPLQDTVGKQHLYCLLVAVTRVLAASGAGCDGEFSGCAAARNYLRGGGWTAVRPFIGLNPEAAANTRMSVTTNQRQPGTQAWGGIHLFLTPTLARCFALNRVIYQCMNAGQNN